MEIKLTCNDDAVLIINTMLNKKRNFVQKAQIHHFVLLGGGWYTE